MVRDLAFVKQSYPLHPLPNKSRPIFAPLFGGLVLLNLFVVGLLSLWQYQSWSQYRMRAYTATENLATTLQHDILDNIGMVDIALLAVAREKSFHAHEDIIDLAPFTRYFAQIQQRLPELYAVRITDAAGTIIAATDASAGADKSMIQIGRSVADRDYFHTARDDPRSGLIISKPLIGATSHKWAMIFARRLERADGSFDGIVYGALILERYLTLFSGVDLGKQGVVALRDGELTMIVRQPSAIDPDSPPERLRPPDSLKRLVESGRKSGYYESISRVDGVARLFFVQQVGDFPLYIAVGVGKEEAFAGWRHDLYRIIALALVFAAASATVTGLFWRSWCRRCLAEQHIQSLNEELEDRVQQRTAQLEALNQDLIRARDAADAGARAKADFLANMSHEIRTPMNAVIGFTHLALATELTARQRDYIEKIMNAARSLLRLINDVLDFSKIDADKMVLEQIPFALDSLLTEVSDILAVPVSDKQLDMRFDTARDVPPVLVGDPSRLHQVLLNLLSNAVKFTERGMVRLSVTVVAPAQTERVTLRFEVADSGIGLSEEQQRHLFIPFDQADSSITRRYGGTGLGLAIARRLVELMGGEIGVDSALGQGAHFWFTAEFGISAAPPAPRAPRKTERQGPARLAGARVLVVEDNEINRMVTRDILEQAGVTAQFAQNGVEGVRAVLVGGPFDGVLMDVQMPRMDGYTATRLIRANPDFVTLPIIALTANALQGDREAALAAGMNDYIAKPVDPDAALETLSRWIRKGNPAATGAAGAGLDRTASTASTAAPVSGVLDRTAGLRRVGGNKALYDQILVRFTEDAGRFSATFSALFDAGDLVAAGRMAHSLKSSAGTIGADEVQRAASCLEEFCRSPQQSGTVAAPLDALSEAIGRLLSELALVPSEPLGR